MLPRCLNGGYSQATLNDRCHGHWPPVHMEVGPRACTDVPTLPVTRLIWRVTSERNEIDVPVVFMKLIMNEVNGFCHRLM